MHINCSPVLESLDSIVSALVLKRRAEFVAGSNISLFSTNSMFHWLLHLLFLIHRMQLLFPRIVPPVALRLLQQAHPLLKLFALVEPVPVASATRRSKNKVVFILGSTGSGKTKLAVALAKRFYGEVINSDKMQVYAGLDVITNKATEAERRGVPHHLLGVVPQDVDFTAADFRREAARSVESVLRRGRLPIVAGGSNSYIEELVEGRDGDFRSRYECCFLWVDVEAAVLHRVVAARVQKMVEQGLVEEARAALRSDGDYSRGIRRSIGVAEMAGFVRAEGSADEETRARMLAAAVDEIKANTCKLAGRQMDKIRRLRGMKGWDVYRVDATEFFARRVEGCAGVEEEEHWERVVTEPSAEITRRFLCHGTDDFEEECAELVRGGVQLCKFRCKTHSSFSF